MPLYDYICEGCGDKTAIFQTFKEREDFDHVCLKCGGKVERDWELGTKIALHRTTDNSRGGIFSKKFWKKSRWI